MDKAGHIAIGEDGKPVVLVARDESGKDVEAVWVTSAGIKRFDKVPSGWYVIRETKTPTQEGYATCPDRVVYVGNDETIAPNGKMTISGDETVYFSFTYDDDGVTIANVPEYEADTKNGKVALYDKPITVEISKIDAATEKELPGAVLTLYRVDEDEDTVIETWTSTKTSHVVKYLTPGRYKLHEDTVPLGYYTTENTIEFDVSNTEEIQKCVMGSEEAVKKDGVAELMKLYVKFHEEAEKNPELNDEARAWFAKMEHGDEEALKIWQWFKDISLIEYKRTYDLLGMDFDYYLGESFYRDKTDDVVKRLTDANLLTESEGAKIVNLDAYDMAPCLILKNDGSSIYATRDIAAIFYRKETYNFVKCLYVTGQEQKLHFKQVFKVVELLGNEWAKDQLVHIPYGLVSLEGAKLSTRSGNIIYAEDILLEAIAKIKEIINEKNPDLPDKDETAKKIGVGAVLFNDLYNQRIKDVSFKWEKLLNFDGETGPYVQYTHARCCSILKKLDGFTPSADIDYSVLTDVEAMELLKEINRFPKVVKDASERYEPSAVARFAVDVAQAFNKFYNACRIHVEEENVRNARATLVYITKKTIKDAMELLGIDCPEQM